MVVGWRRIAAASKLLASMLAHGRGWRIEEDGVPLDGCQDRMQFPVHAA